MLGVTMLLANGWRVASPDEDTTVRWRITKDTEGALLIEDVVQTTAQASLQEAVALFLDVPGHTEFSGDVESRVLQTLSPDRWLVYTFTRNPWPLRDSDRVSELSYVLDQEAGQATFRLVATPEAHPDQGVPRQAHFQWTYTFLDLGDGRLQIREEGAGVPPVRVPRWLVASAFPDAPLDSMRKVVALLEGQ
jgi:hypothetical protein